MSDYDWLYGDKRRGAKPPPPEDPATSVMHIADEPPPVQPRRKRRFKRRRLLYLVLIAWLAFLIAVPFLAWSNVARVSIAHAGARPAEQPGTTYLLVGSDSREGLTQEQHREFGTGGVGNVGRRTDTIMLLHTGAGPNLLLSIPRDSIVPIPGYGTTKINAAFAYGGPKLLTQTIEDATGIRIDAYIEIGFAGFVSAVDAVGGIEICPKQDMSDRRANLRIKKGCQEVDGPTALGYARSRHTSALGDIDRAARQREVLGAIADKAKSWQTLVNPIRYRKLVDSGIGSVQVNQKMSLFGFGKFALAMTRLDGDAGMTCGMPIRDLAVNWDTERANRLFRLIAEDRTEDIPASLCREDGLTNR